MTITVFNSLGQMVKSQQTHSEIAEPVELEMDVPSGHYLVEMRSDNSKVKVKKLIVTSRS